MAKLTDKDLYGILEVDQDATEKEILKAYRKKALKCHPDKNPDNPKAVELFHELSDALEILTDVAARAAYDQTLKAKKAAQERHKELDSKRKKFKEDLEAREKRYAEQQQKGQDSRLARNLQVEVERLRKEGSRLLEDEQQRLKEELLKEQENKDAGEGDTEAAAARLKVRWKAKKGDADNGGYNSEMLHRLFSKYGDVTALVLSGKKKGSAIVELASAHAAVMAEQLEIGLPDNPLTLTWLSGKPSDSAQVNQRPPDGATQYRPLHPLPATSCQFTAPTDDTNSDFESLVLRRLRQAEERKKLEDAILAENGD